MFANALYVGSPAWLQNILLSVRGGIRKVIRERNYSAELYRQLLNNENSSDELSCFRNKQIELALRNAVSNIPFYREVGDANEIALENFKCISKSDVRAKPDAFRSAIKPKVIVNGGTSGTTGSPLSIPQAMESIYREHAFVTRSLAWAGYKKGDKRAWIRGDMIVPIKQKKPPYWRYSWFEDMIQLSSYHMTADALPQYIQAMVDYGVDVIQAHPSTISFLAKYLESKGDYYPGNIKSVLTSSETLSPEDRKVIEERFRCKVFDWYGLFERVAAIASCEHGRYHVLTDYSHVEFIDAGDGRYEIVGTNFNNHYYPLIRYKTGDYVVMSKETTCPCGRVYPIVERIEGRTICYLIGEDGQKVHNLHNIPSGVAGLLGCQFIQETRDLIQVVVVVDQNIFNEVEELKLARNVRGRLGQSLQVKIKRVSALPRTKDGKFIRAICTIKDI